MSRLGKDEQDVQEAALITIIVSSALADARLNALVQLLQLKQNIKEASVKPDVVNP